MDKSTGDALSLFPLYYVDECDNRSGGINIYIFDKYDQDICKFKLVDEDTRISVEAEIAEAIISIKDDTLYKTEIFKLTVEEI